MMNDRADQPGLDHVLASCVRNEGPSMVEFIAHHRVLGFDGIYIASNDCTDGTDVLLARLAEAGVIGHTDQPVPEGKGAQMHGFALLRRTFGLVRAKWLQVLDADEFLIVNTGAGRVQDLTAALAPDIDILAIAPRTFGSALTSPVSSPDRVCRRFQMRVLDRNPANGQIKTLTRNPSQYRRIDHHCVIDFQGDRPVRVQGSDGTPFEVPPHQLHEHLRHADPRTAGRELAWYNHYAVKSPEEFLLRRLRGRGVSSTTDRHRAEYFADRASVARIRDDTILTRYGEAVEAEIARLLALPGVAEAQAATEALTAAEIARLDPAAVAELTKVAVPVRRKVPAAAPRTEPERGSLGHALVSTMKNEGSYALEFVAHHRVLGFDGIYIASNDCTDGTDLLLDALAAGGAIHHLRSTVNPGEAPNHKGYRLLRRTFGLDRAAWLMAMDVDEFLHISLPGGTVQDLTARAPGDVDVIALSSLTFGAGAPGQPWSPERVCRRFTLRVPAKHPVNGPIKSLTRNPHRFRQIHNHSMVGFKPDRPVRAMRGDGEVFDLDPALPEWQELRNFQRHQIGHDLAHYNHYAIKSAEEFTLRRNRGRGGTGDPTLLRHTDDYFARRAEAATVEDTRILNRYGVAVEAEMARLLALPGVAEAQAACVAYLAATLGKSD